MIKVADTGGGVIMAAIKIEPPAKLPEQGLTEVQFNIWVEELEVYLQQGWQSAIQIYQQKFNFEWANS